MTKEVLAAELNGIEYRDLRTKKELLQIAKENDLVVFVGESDDIITIAGAIVDEVYGKVLLVKPGELVLLEHEDTPEPFDGVYLKPSSYGAINIEDDEGENPTGNEVAGIFGHDGWAFKTELPHATFNVIDDDDEPGEIQCVGIVIDLKDLIVNDKN